MKFAIVDGQKVEAQKGLYGICANCQSDTIAHCGPVKIWHWKHKSKKKCDPWWENETAWHREWKNKFPKEWQEVLHIDSTTGEKHTADIKTDKEFIIEFQNSPIKLGEIEGREAFYKNMVWVVNGARLKFVYPRFSKGFSELIHLKIPGFFLTSFPDECFPQSWLNRSVPVYFDFQLHDSNNPLEYLRSPLWCLFPGRMEGYSMVAGVSREDFMKFAYNDHRLLFAHKILSEMSQLLKVEFANRKRGQSMRVASYLNRTISPMRRRYRHL
jgi:competence protein CoiA